MQKCEKRNKKLQSGRDATQLQQPFTFFLPSFTGIPLYDWGLTHILACDLMFTFQWVLPAL